jgi:hypothetical protein
MAGLLDRICVKTVEKVEVTLPPPPLVGRGRPLKVTALMSPEQIVDGVKRLILDDVRLILDCPVTVRLLRESKSKVLYAENAIAEFKLLK